MKPPSLEDLRRMTYFAELPDAEAGHFAAQLSVRSYQPRDLVVVQGAPTSGFYFVRQGRARLFRTGIDGREQTLRLLASGDTFGEVPAVDGGPVPATIEALDPTEIVLIPADAFRELMFRHPEVAHALLRHFARRMRAFTEMVEAISLQTVQARLARYLYQLARVEGEPVEGGILVPREITQQDLASLLGSVREVVSRTLSSMEDDGILEVQRRQILVRDLARLQALV